MKNCSNCCNWYTETSYTPKSSNRGFCISDPDFVIGELITRGCKQRDGSFCCHKWKGYSGMPSMSMMDGPQYETAEQLHIAWAKYAKTFHEIMDDMPNKSDETYRYWFGIYEKSKG